MKQILETLRAMYLETKPGSDEAIALITAIKYLGHHQSAYKPRHATEKGQEVYVGEFNL